MIAVDEADTSRFEGRSDRRMLGYSHFWQNDASDEKEAHKHNRLDQYAEVTNGYYDGATVFFENGWSRSFHFCRFFKGEPFQQALVRHEHYLASQMRLEPGMRVLDVGCGLGGPAREFARFCDVTIVGVNNNDFQLNRARKYTREAGLEDQVTYVKGDFMRLSEIFQGESFDAVFAIEATLHAPSFEGVYGEIFKVLKPGGIFGMYEWAMTEKWDPSLPEHKRIAHAIELGDGIPEMRPMKSCLNALETVGFNVLKFDDLASRDDELPWYYPLEGDISKAQTLFDYFTIWRKSWSGRLVALCVAHALEFIGVAPKGTCKIGAALETAAISLVEGGKHKIFTPMLLVISRKPENPPPVASLNALIS